MGNRSFLLCLIGMLIWPPFGYTQDSTQSKYSFATGISYTSNQVNLYMVNGSGNSINDLHDKMRRNDVVRLVFE